eukprot:Rhum_TRINITY_DN14639_c12_g3::Rhum_TRINITY_DN14639_c12_g3_i1::g.106769::m.106769
MTVADNPDVAVVVRLEKHLPPCGLSFSQGTAGICSKAHKQGLIRRWPLFYKLKGGTMYFLLPHKYLSEYGTSSVPSASPIPLSVRRRRQRGRQMRGRRKQQRVRHHRGRRGSRDGLQRILLRAKVADLCRQLLKLRLQHRRLLHGLDQLRLEVALPLLGLHKHLRLLPHQARQVLFRLRDLLPAPRSLPHKPALLVLPQLLPPIVDVVQQRRLLLVDRHARLLAVRHQLGLLRLQRPGLRPQRLQQGLQLLRPLLPPHPAVLVCVEQHAGRRVAHAQARTPGGEGDGCRGVRRRRRRQLSNGERRLAERVDAFRGHGLRLGAGERLVDQQLHGGEHVLKLLHAWLPPPEAPRARCARRLRRHNVAVELVRVVVRRRRRRQLGAPAAVARAAAGQHALRRERNARRTVRRAFGDAARRARDDVLRGVRLLRLVLVLVLVLLLLLLLLVLLVVLRKLVGLVAVVGRPGLRRRHSGHEGAAAAAAAWAARPSAAAVALALHLCEAAPEPPQLALRQHKLAAEARQV